MTSPESFRSRLKESFGYWKTATDIDTACRDMARLPADDVKLKPQDRLPDAGCGCGDQDMLYREEYDVSKVTGLNTTPVHTRIGRVSGASRSRSPGWSTIPMIFEVS